MNEVIINKALFTLVCTDYGKENADAILDILSNTTYTIDPDYVEELYSKQLLLFRDHETLIKIDGCDSDEIANKTLIWAH